MQRMLAFLLILAALAPPVAVASGKLGIQAGISKNSLTGQLPPEGSWESASAFGASAVLEFDLAEDISLSLQPGYTPRESKRVFKDGGEVIDEIGYATNYVTVPLLVRVTGDPLGVRGFVTAGVELSFLLDAGVTVESESMDLTDDFESTTLGALFGAGVMVPLGRQFLSFEVRYVQGLDDIVQRNDSAEIPGISAPSVKYRGVQVMAGYLVPLGRR